MHQRKLGDRGFLELRVLFAAGNGHKGHGVPLQEKGVQHLFLQTAVGLAAVNGLKRLGRSIGMDKAQVPNGRPPQLGILFRLRCLEDRKSTRLNSSHGYISYAVFCLKKKTHSQSSPHLLLDTRTIGIYGLEFSSVVSPRARVPSVHPPPRLRL